MRQRSDLSSAGFDGTNSDREPGTIPFWNPIKRGVGSQVLQIGIHGGVDLQTSPQQQATPVVEGLAENWIIVNFIDCIGAKVGGLSGGSTSLLTRRNLQ